MQERDIVKQCFGIQLTPKLQGASAIMPHSSAAVGCAGATFDFGSALALMRQMVLFLEKKYQNAINNTATTI